jgi:hypothetical protein
VGAGSRSARTPSGPAWFGLAASGAVGVSSWDFRDWQSGAVLGQVPLGDGWPLGRAVYNVHRADLTGARRSAIGTSRRPVRAVEQQGGRPRSASPMSWATVVGVRVAGRRPTDLVAAVAGAASHRGGRARPG